MRHRIPTIQSAMLMLFLAVVVPCKLSAQSTDITTEYLMTLYARLDVPQAIDESLTVYNASDDGWVKGPKIDGTLLAPSGDWLQSLPNGASRLDVRATIETDDGARIYISYNGIAKSTEASRVKLQNGEVVTSDDLYFLTAPTMRTSSEKYAWLNHVQCIGKMVEFKSGEGGYVKYDIFIAR